MELLATNNDRTKQVAILAESNQGHIQQTSEQLTSIMLQLTRNEAKSTRYESLTSQIIESLNAISTNRNEDTEIAKEAAATSSIRINTLQDMMLKSNQSNNKYLAEFESKILDKFQGIIEQTISKLIDQQKLKDQEMLITIAQATERQQSEMHRIRTEVSDIKDAKASSATTTT